MCVCTYSMCIPGTHRDQQSVSVPLMLELQMFVRCHVSDGDATWVYGKSSQRS